VGADVSNLNPYCINEGLATGNEGYDAFWLEAVIAKVKG
jgi:hypothetical protein